MEEALRNALSSGSVDAVRALLKGTCEITHSEPYATSLPVPQSEPLDRLVASADATANMLLSNGLEALDFTKTVIILL